MDTFESDLINRHTTMEPTRQMQPQRGWRGPVLVIAAVALLFGGSGSFFVLRSRAAPDQAAQAAQTWGTAVLAGDTATARAWTCSSRQTVIEPATMFWFLVEAGATKLLGPFTPSVDVIAVSYESVEVRGDRALVEATATVQATLFGVVRTATVSLPLVMQREQGQWRFCGP